MDNIPATFSQAIFFIKQIFQLHANFHTVTRNKGFEQILVHDFHTEIVIYRLTGQSDGLAIGFCPHHRKNFKTMLLNAREIDKS